MGADDKSALGAARLIDDTVSELHQAQQKLRELQCKHVPGSPVWHALETIDDHIHNALGKLGD